MQTISPLRHRDRAGPRAAVVEGVDVRVEHDKAFNFRPIMTWGWNPDGAGDVRMARTQEDDAAVAKKRRADLIMDAVATEMTRRGLKQAAARRT